MKSPVMQVVKRAVAALLVAGFVLFTSLLVTFAPAASSPVVAPTPAALGERVGSTRGNRLELLVAGEGGLEEAFRAALQAYLAEAAPGAPLVLGEIHEQAGWAYAVAQPEPSARTGEGRYAVLLGCYGPGGWRVLAPSPASRREYNALLDAFPPALLDESARARLHLPDSAAAQESFLGHKLPWPAGQYAYMTQIDVSPYHMDQVDFDILGLTAAGDVYASKPGRVVFVKECSNTGACDSTASGKENVIVIEHGSGEYSWYLHLAYNSVPVEVGDWVDYGTRIGTEGETGYACGVHLHYMVSTGHTTWTDPTNPNVSPWGLGITAVDFYEVAWSDMEVDHIYTSTNAAPAPALRLELAEGLSLSPALPVSGWPVTATFSVRNVGTRAVTLAATAALACGPGCTDWSCTNEADFPAGPNVTLEPGAVYTYCQQRIFGAAGSGFLAAPAFMDADGVWQRELLGGDSVGFSVSGDFSERVYLPLILTE